MINNEKVVTLWETTWYISVQHKVACNWYVMKSNRLTNPTLLENDCVKMFKSSLEINVQVIYEFVLNV